MTTTSTQPKVNDLLAELDAEFGKAARKGSAANGKALPPAKHKALNAVYHQRNATGDFRDEVSLANTLTKSWKEVPGFQPVATIHRIHHQHCRTCWSKVSYIANEFTRFHSVRLHATVDAPEVGHVDEFGLPLPQLTEHHYVDVELCADCLSLSPRVDDLLEAIPFITGHPTQRKLWQ